MALFQCSKKSDPAPSPGPSAFHGVRVYIISMNDVHEYSGKLAQFQTLEKKICDTAAHVYTVMAGDFFMVHHSYNVNRCDQQTDYGVLPDLKVPKDSSQLTVGLAMARMIEYLDFDAIVPGNHDWTYGIAMLQRPALIQKLIGCNISQPSGLTADYLSFTSGSGHYTLNLIGVAGNDNIHTKTGESVIIHPVTTTTSVNKIKSAIATGNMNVLVTHLTNADDQSAFTNICTGQGVPLFDGLCGGHTHNSEAKLESGAGYVKAGLYDTYAGLTCLWWDTVKQQVVRRTTQLVCLGDFNPDPGTVALIDSLHLVYPHYP
ncbi:MAG: metallophosphoesterase [bacterium]